MPEENNKGFTLIELLIVIGIIAILAAAVIIAINPGQQFAQARNSTRRSHLNSVANAVYSYSIENEGTYPDCVGDSWAGLEGCSTDLEDYISELPVDPQASGDDAGEDYEIRLGGDGNNIELRSEATEWEDLDDNVITQ